MMVITLGEAEREFAESVRYSEALVTVVDRS
jgi:hypothetical protein